MEFGFYPCAAVSRWKIHACSRVGCSSVPPCLLCCCLWTPSYIRLNRKLSHRGRSYAPAIEHTDSRKQKQTSHEITSLAIDLHTLSSLSSPQNIPDAQKSRHVKQRGTACHRHRRKLVKLGKILGHQTAGCNKFLLGVKSRGSGTEVP